MGKWVKVFGVIIRGTVKQVARIKSAKRRENTETLIPVKSKSQIIKVVKPRPIGNASTERSLVPVIGHKIEVTV